MLFHPQKHEAFTIVELIVVLVIITTVAVLAIPRFATSPNLEAQTQALLADIRYTQMLAMTHGQRFRINFTLPNTYSITTTSGTAIPNPSTNTNTITLTSGVTMTALTNLPNNLIAFDEEGIPYTDSTATTELAANATITLSRNAMTRQILVNAKTGSASLQ